MPAVVYRRLGYIGAAKQTSQGTPVAPSRFFKFTRHAFVADQTITSYRDPNTRDRTFNLKELFKFAGTFQTFLYSDEGGALLAWAMGADNVTGASDPYTHTISFADGLPWLSFELGQYMDNSGAYGLIERVQDCKLTGLQIEGEAGKPVLLTPDIIGITVAKQTNGATVTYSAGGGEPMTFTQGVFTITGPSDASVLQGQIQKFSVGIKNNVQPVQANAFTAISLLETAREVDLSLTAVFSGPSVYQLTYFGGPSATAPSPTLGSGSLTIVITAQAAPEHSVTLTLGALDFSVVKLEMNPDGNVAKADITAIPRKSGATMPLAVTVKNAVAQAYV